VGLDWIHLAQDKDRKLHVVNSGTINWVSKKCG
jgi:hypothetical protein